ncbi:MULTISPECIES: hypothetical protein [Micromonospora]|uniref:hypothetical protein n=1 Tax=Micromonospora TaxID=1873 RepID=UPI001B375268|nr:MULTISPECIES: hypothetical protein [Micromonospora]MBQ0982668.1 hypothetical protein [Micromonospora sp. M61]MBQ1035131.1 hypothetical protein [Micromonospora sp. C81]WSK49393.1 hypothetical protein OG423_02895 [Micromonospora zamorensis]WTE87931.1 hypothetical protein OHA01_04330 [Micromonospora zamorensis]WTI22678.1 hypothetical protein OG886_06300 [Micromonospora zamorensis]
MTVTQRSHSEWVGAHCAPIFPGVGAAGAAVAGVPAPATMISAAAVLDSQALVR